MTSFDRGAQPARVLVGAAFFLSGVAALVYQVAWQRILALQSGVGIYSVAMIVAAFMAGLGVGSRWGGRASAHLTPHAALRRFVAIELGIAAFGFLSCFIYYDLLYTRAAWLYAEPWHAGLLHFASLFLPTALMGMSLPYLSRAMVTEAEEAGGTIGLLYGVNLIGAGVGAFLTPWVLIRFFGIRGAVAAAAFSNLGAVLLAGGAAVLMRGRTSTEAPEPASPASEAPPAALARQPFALWIALYALSGFCALSLEILWFRLVDVAVRSKAQTFGTVLCVYLLGSAFGCLAAVPRVRRLARPLRAFLLCQCALLAYAGATAIVLARVPFEAWLGTPWQSSYHSVSVFTMPRLELLGLYVGLPALLFGPATVLMGASFPILQRAVQDDPRSSGRKVGVLQAANILGCTAGSLLIGLVSLDRLGTAGTLRLLLAIGVVFAIVGVRAYGPRSPFPAVAALLVLLTMTLPGGRRLWMRLHGTDDPRALLHEDATSVGALVPRNDRWTVYVDGKSHSWLPFGGVHTVLGAVPAIVHPSPEDVAIIGLGSGDSAWAAGCRAETRSITVFEISAPQPALLASVAAISDLPELTALLGDPRLRLRLGDGRNAILQQERLYDLIEADGLWPDVGYSGNLYSAEFFRACARRLKPGGVVCTWAPTPRVYTTFTSVFPHVIGADRERGILIGSPDPLPITPDAWRARLAAAEGYLHRNRAKPVAALLERLEPWPHEGHEADEDLFPRDEFLTPER
jgi:spermidine synthase